MATWQFDFHIIPRSKILALFGNIPDSLGMEMFDSVECWEDARLPEDYETFLSSLVPESVHWSATTRMWGEENGDRIEISSEDGVVNYIFARLDVSKRNDVFLEGIVRFASDADAVLVTSKKGKVLEPSVEALVAQVKESNAYRFVRDPEGFFESISKGDIGFGDST